MRNLKRVFSLALALVMVLGMMVICSSAATYPDADEITYNEAIDVLAGLGILEGDENSYMNPTDVLTREQAAKIMAYITLGADDAEKLGKNTQIFTDVPAGKWSAGYIAYCANVGIIAGAGDGTFNPTGVLTGTAFAKMLLVAAGYDATVEGYVNNADWDANIAVDAMTANIDVKGIALEAQVTREQAAQMVLQALEMDTVTYVTGNVIGKIGPYTVERTGAKLDYATQAAEGRNGTEQFCEKYFAGLYKNDTPDADEWGNPAEYEWYYKKATNVLYTELAEPVAEYFTAVSDCDMYTELGLKVNNTEYELFVDGKQEADEAWNKYEVRQAKNGTGTGVWTRIYDMGTAGYRMVAINTYFGEVTKLYEQKADKNGHITQYEGINVTFTNAPTGTLGFYATSDEYAKKDCVLANVCYVDTDYDGADDTWVIAYVEPAEYVTAKVTKRVVGDEPVMDVITAGTVYGQNVKYAAADVLTRNNEYNLYLDFYGNVISAKATRSIYAYGVIDAIKWVDGNNVLDDGYAAANIVTMDADTGAMAGTELVYDDINDVYLYYAADGVASDAGEVATSIQARYNGKWYDRLFKYEKNADGSYDIVDEATKAPEITEIEAGTYNTVSDKDGKYARTNNTTVYLVKTIENRKVVYTSYTGYKNVPDMTDVADVQYFTKDGYVSMMYIDASGATFEGETDVVYIFSDDVVAYEKGTEIFEAYVGTAKTDMYTATDVATVLNATDYAGAGVYEVSYNAAGEVLAVEAITKTMTSIDYCDGDVMENWDGNTLVDDVDVTDAVFYKVAGNKVVPGSAEDLGSGDDQYTTAVLVTNIRKVVVAVYYGW